MVPVNERQIELEVVGGVMERTGEPVVAVRIGAHTALLTLDEARDHAAKVLESAGAAAADAELREFLQVCDDPGTARVFIAALQSFRKRGDEPQPEQTQPRPEPIGVCGGPAGDRAASPAPVDGLTAPAL